MKFLILFIFISGCLSYHEHNQHLDLDFIEKEVTRLLYVRKPVYTTNIDNYAQTLAFIANRYDIYIEENAKGSRHAQIAAREWERVDDGGMYLRVWDLLRMNWFTCDYLWPGDDLCSLNRTLFREDLDDRGEEFQSEFEAEMQLLIRKTGKSIKEYRRSKDDL